MEGGKRGGTRPNFIKRFFSVLGPGLITGAADDDPSGIATYSIAGAQLGTSLLWTAFITWPLMAPVQRMCARIGMCTGKGLAGALRDKFPKRLVALVALALLIANTINVGADLSGMADAAEMLTGFNSHYFVVLFGLIIAYATIRFRYYQIANVLKWLAATLFAYVITAIVIRPDWTTIVHDTFVPSWPKGHEAWATLVAILGTTISPYLFFWQASQEVEEEKAMGRRMRIRRQGATSKEIRDRKLDVGVGTFFSNLVMYFIILTTALTLHLHGITNIETSSQAAGALAPLAGKFAATLFTGRITCHSDADRLGRVCLCRNFSLAARARSKIQVRSIVLRDHHLVDRNRDWVGLRESKSGQSPFLDGGDQWAVGAFSSGWNFDGRV